MKPQRVVSGYNSELKAGNPNGEKCWGRGEIKIISLIFISQKLPFLLIKTSFCANLKKAFEKTLL